MLPIDSFRTLAISTTNLQEAERFYTEVLGGKVVERVEPQPGGHRPREVVVQVGNIKVALADASGGPLAGFPHYTMRSQAFRPKEELLTEFETRGVPIEVVRDHADGQGYSVTIRDGDGHLLELTVRKAG